MCEYIYIYICVCVYVCVCLFVYTFMFTPETLTYPKIPPNPEYHLANPGFPLPTPALDQTEIFFSFENGHVCPNGISRASATISLTCNHVIFP